MNVVIVNNGVTSVGVTASQGIPGPTGPQGPAGPNQVSTSTTTNINGILAGNGTTVQEAQMNTNKLLGRTTAGAGDIEEISIGDGLTLSGGILSAGAGGLKSGIATAAVTDVYTTTITGVTGYATNDAYVIKFNTANSDGATININGLGAKQLVKNNNVIITGGDIQVGQEFIIIYDGTNFQMLGIAPNQMFAYVTNADTVTINKGQVVYAFGASGDRMSVKLANNTGDATSAKTIGLVFSTSIAANGTGFIITQGVIQNLNLGAYNAGDTLYLGATPGSYTNVKPYAPNHLVYVGIVERANAGNGQIYVRCVNGYEMDELHDVQSQGAVNKDVLYRDTTVSPNLWKPASITTILGYTPEDAANKSTSTGDGASSVKFPVWSAVVSYVTGLGYLLASTAASTYQTLANIVTSFGATPSDSKYPSEKLVKDSLDSKQNTLVSGTNIKTIENQSILGSGNIDLTKSDVGLSNVDNTSDLNKPISTATQTAIDNISTVGSDLYLFNNY